MRSNTDYCTQLTSSQLDLACDIIVIICLFFSLQEHTNVIHAVQCDDFHVIGGSKDGTLVIYDFLDPTPPFLRT